MAQEKLSLHGKEIFVLVHGATSDASAWDPVAPFLRALGHQVYAVNLPGHGPDPANLAEQTLTTYADHVAKLILQLDRPVILVGHSMGGAVITMVGEKVPERISKLVYLAAWLLEPGLSCNNPACSYEPHDLYAASEDGKTVSGSAFALDRPADFHPPRLYAHTYYEAPANPRAREAIAALFEPVYPTEARWGSIRRFYIEALQDESITPAVEEKMLEKLPCERVYTLDTGHSPQRTMPQELCVILHDIARA